jgi:BlaI family penicillinase repressor
MKRFPRISELEWEVMNVIWKEPMCSAAEVIANLKSFGNGWHPKTAKTLLNRLVGKGALRFRKKGRAYLYFANVSESECVAAASERFLTRIFRGSVARLLVHFIETYPRKGNEGQLRAFVSPGSFHARESDKPTKPASKVTSAA